MRQVTGRAPLPPAVNSKMSGVGAFCTEVIMPKLTLAGRATRGAEARGTVHPRVLCNTWAGTGGACGQCGRGTDDCGIQFACASSPETREAPARPRPAQGAPPAKTQCHCQCRPRLSGTMISLSDPMLPAHWDAEEPGEHHCACHLRLGLVVGQGTCLGNGVPVSSRQESSRELKTDSESQNRAICFHTEGIRLKVLQVLIAAHLSQKSSAVLLDFFSSMPECSSEPFCTACKPQDMHDMHDAPANLGLVSVHVRKLVWQD